jgi:gliding motility-associated-like protein
VSVTINPTGVFALNNEFRLELSGPGGDWSTPTTLSTLTEFYVPAINGTLPGGLAPGSYKLRVVSTNPATVSAETASFNVISGSGGATPAFKSSLTNGDYFNCITTCTPDNNMFGYLKAPAESSLNLGAGLRANTICDYNPAYTYSVTFYSISSGTTQNLTIGGGVFYLPTSIPLGAYVVEICRTNGGISSCFSNIFLNCGNGTGLPNLSGTDICVGTNAVFEVTGISRNYYGSKYRIDFGDGYSVEYTHAQLMANPIVSHTYDLVSCEVSSTGQFVVDLKLYNKGIYKDVGNPNYCNTYYENGQSGSQKTVVTSRAPVVDFTLQSTIQCQTTPIVATNTTTTGKYGVNCQTALTYEWYYKKPSSPDFIYVNTDFPSYASWVDSDFNLTIPPSAIDETGCWQIRLDAYNNGGCIVKDTVVKDIKIETPVVASYTPSATQICAGNVITFTNTSSVVGKSCEEPSYSWTITPVGSPATATGFAIESGYSTTSQNLAVKFNDPGKYRVTLTILNTCGSNSYYQDIDCLGNPTVSFPNTSASVCENNPAGYVVNFATTYTPIFSTTPFVATAYEWTVSGAGVTTADYEFVGGTDATSQFPQIKFKAFKAFIIKVKAFGNCSAPAEDTFTLTVKEIPVITNTNLTQEICSGESSTAIALNSSVAGTTYTWTVTKTANISATVANGSGSTIPAITLQNTSATTGTVTYTVTPTANGCVGADKQFVITVYAKPQIANISQTICNGDAFTISPANTGSNIVPTGTTYSWAAPVSAPAGAITGGSAQSGQTSISQTLTNNTNAVATLTYTVIPKSGTGSGCEGNPFTVTITVNPTPTVNKPADQTLCNTLTTNAITFSGNVSSGVTYSWVNNNTAIGLAASGTGDIAAFAAQNTTDLPITAQITVTPYIGTCAGASQTFLINVNPSPLMDEQPQSSTVCVNGVATTLSVSFLKGTGTPTYQWYRNTANNTTSGTAIAGENSSSFNPPTNTINTTYYYCIISFGNSGGCSSITSNAAAVTVTPQPTISVDPLGYQKICIGGNIPPLTVEYLGGTGTPKYQWYSNTSNANSGGSPIAGATSKDFTPSTTFNTAGFYYYYVVVDLDGSGCDPVASNIAQVEVIPDPTISTQPLTEQTICQNSAATVLTVVPTGGVGTFSYQWYRNTTNSNVGGIVITGENAGENTNSYTPPTNNAVTTYYYCEITQSGFGCAVKSATAKVNVVEGPKVTFQPLSSVVCKDGAATEMKVEFENGTGTPSYQWYSNTINNTSTGTPIPGAIYATFTPETSSVGTKYYYCEISLSGGGCSTIKSNTASVTVHDQPIVSTQPLSNQRVCVGAVIQPLTVAYTGGTGTPSYQWYVNTVNSTSGGTPILTNGSSPSYTPDVFNTTGTFYYYAVITLNGTGCNIITSNTAEVIVVADPTISAQPLNEQKICQNSPATALVVVPAGGEGTFSYSWYRNSTNSVVGGTEITGENAGEKTNTYTPPTALVGDTYYYCVITQSGLGCNTTSALAKVTVTQGPAFTKQPASSSVCVFGTPTQLEVAYTNGVGTPSYKWFSNITPTNYGGTEIAGATLATYNPPSNVTGTFYYYCEITLNGGGCSTISSNVATVVITPLPAIDKQPLATQNVCVGATIEPLVIENSGGTGTVTYQWYQNSTNSYTGGIPIPGTNSASYTPPPFNSAGSYYYYVTVGVSGNACGDASSHIAEVVVVPDPVVDSQPLSLQEVCQYTTPTTLSVTVSGGVGAYQYQWYRNTVNSNVGGTLIAGATGKDYQAPTDVLGTLYYYCEIKQTGLGCAITSSVSRVNVVQGPTITKQPNSSSVCINGTATKLEIAYTNGTGTATYQWYNNTVNSNTGGIAIAGATAATFDPPTNAEGTIYYYCVITLSGGGCTEVISNTASVVVNPQPVISAQPLATQSICLGGSVDLEVQYAGGTGTATYQWYANSVNLNSGGTPITGATSATYKTNVLNTLGNYYYYVIVSLNGAGCNSMISQAAEVIVVPDPVITTQPIVDQTVCQNTVPSALTVAASGGVETHKYQWYSNISNTTIGGTAITGATNDIYLPSTATVGTMYYYCIVSSGTGCSVISNTSKVVVNKAPAITQQPISATYCKDETPTMLTAAYENGVGTATYQWYINVINTNSGGVAISGATSNTYTPSTAAAGTNYYYCVISISSGGCNSLTTDVAEIIVNQYPVISDYAITTGSGVPFVLTPVSNGTDIVPANTTYRWSNPVVSPAGSVSGASAQNTPVSSLSQTLVNNTKAIATVTYTVTPTSNSCPGHTFKVVVTVNPPINSKTTVSNISCFGANDGAISIVIEGGNPPYTIEWTGPDGYTATSSSITNLHPGAYNLKVTDNGGLPYNSVFTILEPTEFKVITDEETDISCNGAKDGRISITASGGNGNYTYSWTKDGAPFATEADIDNLAPGIYEVTVDDNNLCGPIVITYNITEPDALKITRDWLVDNVCAGDNAGSISVNVSGGTKVDVGGGVMDYLYHWVGPNGFTSNLKDIQHLYSGEYTLSVTDKSGCSTQFTETVAEPLPISVAVTTTPITCYGYDDASITLNVTGGVAPYTAEWDNMASGLYQAGLSAKDYTITIKDANNCTKTVVVNIPEAAIFRINPVVKQISCHGEKNGSIKLNIEGGQGKVTLEWDDDPTAGNERNNIGPGTYTVRIKDEKPCYITRQFIILEPQQLAVSGNVTDALACDNPNSGAIDLEITGGTLPYKILWSNGATTEDLSGIPSGNYFVEVTDSMGCRQMRSFVVTRQMPIEINVTKQYKFDCSNQRFVEECTAQVTGGIPPYQLVWSEGVISGANNEIMQSTQSSTVILTVTDALGCTKSYSFNTNVPHVGISVSTLDCNQHIYQFRLDFPDVLFSNVSYQWNLGDGGTSNIRNPQHTYMKPGNYDVSVIMSSNECNTTFNYRLYVDSIPELKLDKPAKLCKNDSVTLFVTGADRYIWSNGSTADSITIKEPGNYSVTGITRYGCTANYDFTVTYHDYYNYSILTDRDIVSADHSTINFWSQDIPLTRYYWTYGDASTGFGNHVFHNYVVEQAGFVDVQLRAINPGGCEEIATKRIWMTIESIPNTFTPNGDGTNDVFLKGWNLQVFNANGVMLYDGTGGWDGTYKGTPVASDTYYYVVRLFNANTTTSKAGYVTIVR